ncbi:MAG: lasso peptide biosynthesis PqqD family chaperone [Oscillospiraceae bacterium]|nr:lasso peptide biosynthesis PqqD family chaperone [Oscillospiraceae bacterium]
MGKINLESTVRRTGSIVTADMDGETVMMHVESGNYFGLGEVGSTIWAFMEEPVGVREIIEHLSESYDVERERCEAETLDFLNEMVTLGMITEDTAE